jgi:hypothetical protein
MTGFAHLTDDELARLGRQRCCVPGCRRTYRDDGYSEIMCGKHWRLADRKLRRLVTRVLVKGGRRGWPDRLLLLHDRLWQKGKAQAIERAMGL